MARSALVSMTVLSLVAAGCSYRAHLGDHDGGTHTDAATCGSDGECGTDEACYCGRCISTLLDVVWPACNPDCTEASEGDFCTGGWACPAFCPSGGFTCEGGVARRVPAACADAGACACPAPPPGCTYDGWPCPCDHLTCEGEPCGPTTCAAGQTCCNASCGICTSPGETCPGIACSDCDAPLDARGEGPCAAILGYAWNGYGCPAIGGCSCVGADCDRLAPTMEACLDSYAHCPRSCGGFAGFPCRESELCDWEPSAFCGATDATGICIERPTACPPVVDPVCGCDGRTYGSECTAHTLGVDVASSGPCESDCGREDAMGLGFCDGIVGVAWDGSSCSSLSGCSCGGADCDRAAARLSSSDPLATCEAEHAHCPRFFP